MTMRELYSLFEGRGYEVHGRARGRSGHCHLLASKRGTRDYGDKECREFIAARLEDQEAEFVHFLFCISRTALSSSNVQRQTGDPEQFMQVAGLFRFGQFLQEDDSPGRRDEFIILTRSGADDFAMQSPDALRTEVTKAKEAVLNLL